MTPEDHRKAAESLLAEAQAVYEELKVVPAEGTNELLNAGWTHRSQDKIRDNLGKQIAGIRAAALVHATIYAADMSYLTSQPSTHRTHRPEPWAPPRIDPHRHDRG